jgi:hypothetical protein
MANNNNAPRGTRTETHIRTIYSDLSCVTIKFYNTSLSFNFIPFAGKDSRGINQYQKPQQPGQIVGMTTTFTHANAVAMMSAIRENIIPAIAKDEDVAVTIPLANNTEIVLERRNDEFAQKRIFMTISRQGQSGPNNIPYKFEQTVLTITDTTGRNQKVFESGLLSIIYIIEGYLSGINSERHLNKLTEDFAKLQEGNGNGNQTGQNGQKNYGGGYNRGGGGNYQGGGWKNNRGNYNRGGNQNQNNDTPPWETQNNASNPSVGVSSYNITE